MPTFKIRHITRYRYKEPVRDSANQVILFPIRDLFQEVMHQELIITGDPAVEQFSDYYGNTVGSFTYTEPHTELAITSKTTVSVKPRVLPEEDSSAATAQWNELDALKYTFPYIDFVKPVHFEGIDEMMQVPAIAAGRVLSPLTAAKQLTDYVYQNFQYDKAVTDVETTIGEVWKLKAGVCQDFAHVLLVMLRTLGIPARYVSGYICPNKNGMRGEGATHAWVEAYIPFYGWLGLDPTNNCVVNDLHVRLATGRSFMDVSPVKGTYKGTAQHTLDVGVTVSYEGGSIADEQPAALQTQPVKEAGEINNSFRRHIEMMQQQQQ